MQPSSSVRIPSPLFPLPSCLLLPYCTERTSAPNVINVGLLFIIQLHGLDLLTRIKGFVHLTEPAEALRTIGEHNFGHLLIETTWYSKKIIINLEGARRIVLGGWRTALWRTALCTQE